MKVPRPDRFSAGDAYAAAVAQVDLVGDHGLAPGVAAGLGIALQERVRLDFVVPLQIPSELFGGAAEGAGPLTWGPVRVASQLVLVQPTPDGAGGDGVGLGLVPWVGFPVGEQVEGRFSGGALANATWGLPRFTFTGQAGLDFTPIQAFERADRAVLGGGMVWQPLQRMAFGMEGRLWQKMSEASHPQRSPLEATLSGRWVGRGMHLVGGVTGDLIREGPALDLGGLRLFLGGGWGQARDLDPDGDGIVGAADRCPEEPETYNGYRDADGCPDELATVAVVPLHREQVRREARVWIESAGERREGQGIVRVEGWMPEEPVGVRAELACLAGELRGQRLSSGENVVLIEMSPRHTSTLRLLITGVDGMPLRGARVRWLDAGPGCGPSVVALPSGRAEVALGAAVHRVVVEAPEHHPRAFEITVPRGIEEGVRIPLMPK